MTPLRRVLISGSFSIAALTASHAALNAESRETGAHPNGVVELFTSQGCSSCPPADKLLGSLAHNPDMIAVSFPVDYWDYIGWKDTLASPAFTARQKAYASSRGDGHVYTPQVVIDGVTAVVGSDADGVDHAIYVNQGKEGALTVPIQVTDRGGTMHVEIGAGSGELAKAFAGVFILRVARTRTVTIERGENRGHSITYTNVVRAMRKIGEWHGQPETFDITELRGDGEGYVVFLQKGTSDMPGTILAAAKSGL